MGTFLLHNPWVQFYLLYVGALLVVFVWDLLRDARATRTPPDGATHTGLSLPPRRRSQKYSSVGVETGAKDG